MSIEVEIQLSGDWTIGFVIEDGKNRTKEYLDGLRTQRKEAAFRRIVKELDRFSQHGPLQNREKFRNEGGGVYAIKDGQERIYGFFHGTRFFACAAGVSKKSQKPDKNVLDIVQRLKRRIEAKHYKND